MTDLQEHIDKWESWLASAHGCDFDHDTMQAILHVNEAARRVANPDLIAARDRITPIIHNMLNTGKNIECAVIARIAVHAALGITEDE